MFAFFKAVASNWQHFNVGCFTKTLQSDFELVFLSAFHHVIAFLQVLLCPGIWELVESFHIR